ncbi:MAG: citrulline utilization hydrolase CtlX [Gammaproteobacteria bacterium]
MSTPVSQTTRHVLMIRPWSFFSNPETAPSNAFQTTDHDAAVTPQAQAEFDAMVLQLEAQGVHVTVVQDTPEPVTPDAVFPNNWFSTHADGTVVTYPMLPTNRRTERRAEVVRSLTEKHGFDVARQVDLSGFEAQDAFLEGTGSLVLDRVNRCAYACYSPRTHEKVLQAFCRELDFTAVGFDAAGADGTPVYHTNVLMCVGTRFVVVCLESIVASARERVERALRSTHDVVPITMEQMNAFAGNMLELQDADGQALIVMSQTAHDGLDVEQRAKLATYGRLVAVPIPTIETAGGSVRCMLAEIFLPRGGA